MTKVLGKQGEDQAGRFLEGRGYQILTTNFQTRFGEIDIVARDKTSLIFVEVKTRSGEEFGAPEEAVNLKKLGKIMLVANEFMQMHGWSDIPVRMEVVAIITGEEPRLISDIDIDRQDFLG